MKREQTSLLVIDGAAVRQALPMADCVEAVERAMRALSRGAADVPLRTVMKLPGDRRFFGVMPGFLADPLGLGAKVLTVYPDNPQRGLPSHVGLVLLFDTVTGFPLAVMDAAEITALRTAAASAVATRVLARADAASVAILGTGEQARTHLQALSLVRRLRAVRIWGRSIDKARRFAADQGAGLSARIEVCATAEEAVRDADIICTVTSSREPVLNGDWVARGAHVNLVGASRVTAREADDALVVRSRYYVDSRISARAEAGELRHAMDAGLVDESHVIGEIGEVLNGDAAGRTDALGVTVYKSLGVAAQDLAAAHIVYERAHRQNLGTRAPF